LHINLSHSQKLKYLSGKCLLPDKRVLKSRVRFARASEAQFISTLAKRGVRPLKQRNEIPNCSSAVYTWAINLNTMTDQTAHHAKYFAYELSLQKQSRKLKTKHHMIWKWYLSKAPVINEQKNTLLDKSEHQLHETTTKSPLFTIGSKIV